MFYPSSQPDWTEPDDGRPGPAASVDGHALVPDGLIQTPDQLRFSYLAIIEGAKRVLSRSPDSGFEVAILFLEICWFYKFILIKPLLTFLADIVWVKKTHIFACAFSWTGSGYTPLYAKSNTDVNGSWSSWKRSTLFGEFNPKLFCCLIYFSSLN